MSDVAQKVVYVDVNDMPNLKDTMSDVARKVFYVDVGDMPTCEILKILKEKKEKRNNESFSNINTATIAATGV